MVSVLSSAVTFFMWETRVVPKRVGGEKKKKEGAKTLTISDKDEALLGGGDAKSRQRVGHKKKEVSA